MKAYEEIYNFFSNAQTTNPSLTKISDLFSPDKEKDIKISAEAIQEKLFDCTNETSDAKPAPQSLFFSEKRNLSTNTLLQWLKGLELEYLFEILAENGYDDLEFLVEQTLSQQLNEEFLKEIGIKKLGHRKLFLACLEEEAEKYFRRSFPVKSNCCTDETDEDLPELKDWLKSLYLNDLYELFFQSGFKDMSQILYLMNSNYKITEEVLKEIGVCKIGHRQRIMFKLKEDAARFKCKNFHINCEMNKNFVVCGKCVVC